jgi:hypothetical protein
VKHKFCCISVVAMPCDEAIRLKAEYDAALRRWGRTLFSPQLGLESTFRVEAEQVRLVAYEARNETASACLPTGAVVHFAAAKKSSLSKISPSDLFSGLIKLSGYDCEQISGKDQAVKDYKVRSTGE